MNSDDKIYLERPPGQPEYAPQSYVRPAPGGFIEKLEVPAYVADIALRWKGSKPNGDGGIPL